MDCREYLMKAQEAEALANAANNEVTRKMWENLAREYRELAQAAEEVTETLRQRSDQGASVGNVSAMRKAN